VLKQLSQSLQLVNQQKETLKTLKQKLLNEILVPYQLNSCTKNKESGMWNGRMRKGRNNNHLT